MVSFQKAADLGVDLIELDVQSTSDGKIVVLHDPTVDRTTDGSGPIAVMTYADAGRFDAGFRYGAPSFPFRDRGIRIPLLEDVLDSFSNIGFTIELKHSPHPKFFEHLAAVVRTHALHRTIIASEDHGSLKTMRRLLPEVPTNLSRQEVRRFYFMAKLGVSFFFRSPGGVFQVPVYAGGDGDPRGLRVVTRGFVRAAHRSGRPVQVWTINDPVEQGELISLGVDGITTDRPDILNRVLEQTKIFQNRP